MTCIDVSYAQKVYDLWEEGRSLGNVKKNLLCRRVQASGRWYVACCTPPVQCHWTVPSLGYIKQVEGNNLLHRMRWDIIWSYNRYNTAFATQQLTGKRTNRRWTGLRVRSSIADHDNVLVFSTFLDGRNRQSLSSRHWSGFRFIKTNVLAFGVEKQFVGENITLWNAK